MKKIILISIIAFAALAAKSQTLVDTSKYTAFAAGGSTLSIGSYTLVLDTVPCYFREITGVVKGALMGKWTKGFIVKPKGNRWSYNDNFTPYFLYSNKKVVTNKIITQYY